MVAVECRTPFLAMSAVLADYSKYGNHESKRDDVSK